MGMKICTICEQVKPLDAFGITGTKRKGKFFHWYRNQCKKCLNVQHVANARRRCAAVNSSRGALGTR